MKSIFIYVTTALLCGCLTRNTYLEGTSISLGAYLPYDGSLYGVNLISYIDGIKISTSTNSNFQIERFSSQKNSWMFGLMESTSTNQTVFSTKNEPR